MRAVIVNVSVLIPIHLVFHLFLASDHHVAVATVQETAKCLGRIDVFLVWSPSLVEGLLHEVKQLLGYDWLVATLVHFPKISEVPVVERVFQNGCHSVDVDSLASVADDAVILEERGDILQSAIALGV